MIIYNQILTDRSERGSKLKSFVIVSDSSHDLNNSYVKENKIETIPFYIKIGNSDYMKEDIDIKREEFYKYLRDNPKLYPKTSLPSVADYKVKFEKFLSKGTDILCFTVSSKLSGSYQSALVAKDMIEDKYPKRKIYIIDSKSASSGVGLLIKKAVEMREKKISLDKIKNKIEELASTIEVYVLLNTLTYLEKGGRLNKIVRIAGEFLRIKPVISFKENTLNVEKIARGRKKAINYTLNLIEERIGDKASEYNIFIIHGDNKEQAIKIKNKMEREYNTKIDLDSRLVSAAVISHLGPGAIGIGFMKK